MDDAGQNQDISVDTKTYTCSHLSAKRSDRIYISCRAYVQKHKVSMLRMGFSDQIAEKEALTILAVINLQE